MKLQLVLFATAKLAEEKGFDIICDKRYLDRTLSNNRGFQSIGVQAPEQELLRKWLREVHSLNVDVHTWASMEYDYVIVYSDGSIESKEFEPTYEQALEAGLQEALNLIP